MGLAVVFLFLMGPWIIDKSFATLFITKCWCEVNNRHTVPAFGCSSHEEVRDGERGVVQRGKSDVGER